MLDYAMIGAKNENVRKYGKHDETIAFLQSCSCRPEFTTLVLTRSRHMQTSPSLLRLLPQTPSHHKVRFSTRTAISISLPYFCHRLDHCPNRY
jgi:hypothetical protein